MPGPPLDASAFRVVSIPGSGSRSLARMVGCGFNHFLDGKTSYVDHLVELGKTILVPVRRPVRVLISAHKANARADIGRHVPMLLFRQMVDFCESGRGHPILMDVPERRATQETRLVELGASGPFDWSVHPSDQGEDVTGIEHAYEHGLAHDDLPALLEAVQADWLIEWCASIGQRVA